MTFPTSPPPLARALAERNYLQATPVQSAVLAPDTIGRDLLVSAQTGSGKTVAYGLAIARDLLGDAEQFAPAAAPLALIVAPTRELALQVHRELSWLYRHAGARIVSCVGGMDPRREQRELAEGAHIVVGTPGRLCDHLRRNRLDVSQLKAVVLDEADEMLDLGFREDMEFILETTPETRRTLLFSATLPRGIIALAKTYQHDAMRIEVEGAEGGHADIEYRAIRIAPSDVEHAVVNVLRYIESPTAIVFCNTRSAVNHLQTALLERGFAVVALSGELTQNERTGALNALRDGRARVCVATDVAARGIDLPNLGLVIHAELPNDAEVMQHRSGRTGRAGNKGISVLLVPPARRRRAELLLQLAGIEANWGTAPQADEIRSLDQQRMLQDPLFTEEPTPEDQVLAQALLAERSAEQIAVALARMVRARMPAPEDILDPGERPARGRDERPGKSPRAPREHEPRDKAPRPRSAKAGEKHAITGGVWFRAAIGKRKNAEARWLLPMICRRGGITRQDIGAIRILDTTTEFEISSAAADAFAAQIKRPDHDDNIRIEPLIGAKPILPRDDRPPGKPREGTKSQRETRRSKRPDSWSPMVDAALDDPRPPRSKEARLKEAGFPPAKNGHKSESFKKDGFKKDGFKKDGFKKKSKSHDDKPAYVSKARRADPSAKNPPFKKKAKNKFR
ncbi:ATP-dependent RNA helicase DeaD [Rhodopseudomonas thermotolerans]|uniref:ATP-dependent RNA helicase DeaD n=2 Tax=Rhodopseudomonas TaxID=1073 RepID=A0A336JK80_9BRAD|nr:MULTISPECIES: DEAD/DEAH box helicase [Rhodopseudomonas]RED38050.1 ATP-dependent RNA helicase DeaD [Rhodopseudomonas pentothenatexigens]REG05243.1 ATP-dependent RNA helicase DeaD [Rhodopseudomonas thermotolerans]SSW90075.1 ATP-dependent RNA helicase DeaD [Rhodopseudomonas pentothenatexigens]